MAAGFIPALNDARMRFAFPSGISTTCLVSTGDDTGRDAPGAEASLVLPVEVLCFRLAISAQPPPAAVEVPSLPDTAARWRDRLAERPAVSAVYQPMQYPEPVMSLSVRLMNAWSFEGPLYWMPMRGNWLRRKSGVLTNSAVAPSVDLNSGNLSWCEGCSVGTWII